MSSRPDPLNLEELAELPTKLRAYAERSAALDAGLYSLLMRAARALDLVRIKLERPPTALERFLGRRL